MEHVCSFPDARFREIVFCPVRRCPEVRIGTKRGRLRELTGTEKVELLAYLIEATAIGEAMVIIHGRERGVKRAREVLGYPA